MNTAHILLSGSCILAAFWHWAYWDLNVFVLAISRMLVLDLHQIIGIHLLLASLLCLGFGLAHLSGFLGPGMWTSDSLGVVGSIRFVKPAFNLIITSHYRWILWNIHWNMAYIIKTWTFVI
jgi:photosystem II CP47 chlorophyll apoprotein